ncbi:MAG: type 4a pilus biogenesis protein PilO [Verrucomicrobiota bacterium]
MSKLPTPAKIGLLAACVLLALIAGWFLLISPKRADVKTLKQEINDTRDQIAAAHGVRTPTQPPIRVADLFRLSRAMPNTADIPGVLLQISRVAEESGVTFQAITPHDPTSLGAYQRIDIDLTFQGRFYDLSDFLYRLRNLVDVHEGVLNATGRLFSVDSITLDQGQDNFPQVKATLTVSAYVFGDGTAPPVPSGLAPQSGATPSTPAVTNTQPIPPAPEGATAAGA